MKWYKDLHIDDAIFVKGLNQHGVYEIGFYTPHVRCKGCYLLYMGGYYSVFSSDLCKKPGDHGLFYLCKGCWEAEEREQARPISSYLPLLESKPISYQGSSCMIPGWKYIKT